MKKPAFNDYTIKSFPSSRQFTRLFIWKFLLANPYRVKRMMDHDVIDGAPAARFAAGLSELEKSINGISQKS